MLCVFSKYSGRIERAEHARAPLREIIRPDLGGATVHRVGDEAPGAGRRLKDLIASARIGDPGCGVGIVRRSRKLLESCLFPRSYRLRRERVFKGGQFLCDPDGALRIRVRIKLGRVGPNISVHAQLDGVVKLIARDMAARQGPAIDARSLVLQALRG